MYKNHPRPRAQKSLRKRPLLLTLLLTLLLLATSPKLRASQPHSPKPTQASSFATVHAQTTVLTSPDPQPKIGYKKGWDKAKVLAYPKGERPDPSVYLKRCYIKKHLKEFKSGASYFVTQSTLKRYGCDTVGRPDGQFVLPQDQAQQLLKATGGDIAKIEKALGIPPGSWDGKPLLLILIPDPESLHIRMPSGNEAGANDLWIPGGYTPEGYSEAVLDAIPQGQYQSLIINPCQ